MNKSIAELLDVLETHYGAQEPDWPTDPYEFLIWWHCGYPASDAKCAKGWASLLKNVGITPDKILGASTAKLTAALKAGGMIPELRAQRLEEIAMRIQNECNGDLHSALKGPLANTRKVLKKFPNISDPGADRILLFGGMAAIAAVPSNCPQVLVRFISGQERENYAATYREAQQTLEEHLPEKLDVRTRAYLLLKKHGQELCKRTSPKCTECPLSGTCAYFAGKFRGTHQRP